MEKYNNYLSPFSWRYAGDEMRRLWSEDNKRRIWRRIWLALASTQMEYGLVTSEQVSEISEHVNEIDMVTALTIEAEISHDLMAELKHLLPNARLPGVFCIWVLPQWISRTTLMPYAYGPD